MYFITVSEHFDSAHFLSNYSGKCSNIHGHRWIVNVELKAKDLVQSGEKYDMVADFSDIKKNIRQIVADFDHALIIKEGSLRSKTLASLAEEGFKVVSVPFRPTAESFAKFFFDKLKENLMYVSSVTVFETPTNSATYKCEE